MANKNIFERIVDRFTRKESLDPMSVVNALDAANKAMSSENEYHRLCDSFAKSGLKEKVYELPNGRSLVCEMVEISDPSHRVTSAEAKICLHDNDGTIINLLRVDRNDFGTPESIIDGNFLQQLRRHPDERHTGYKLSQDIIADVCQMTMEDKDLHLIKVANGKFMRFVPPAPNDPRQDVTIILLDENRSNPKLIYADFNKIGPNDTPLKSINDVQKYYDKVYEVRRPFRKQGLIEKSLNDSINNKEETILPLPNGSSLVFSPETLTTADCIYETARIELFNKGNLDQTLFYEFVPTNGSLIDITTCGSLRSVQSFYDSQMKNQTGLDSLIGEHSTTTALANDMKSQTKKLENSIQK